MELSPLHKFIEYTFMSNGIFSNIAGQPQFFFRIKDNIKCKYTQQKRQIQVNHIEQQILPLKEQKKYLEIIVNNLCKVQNFTHLKEAKWIKWEQWISVISTMITWHKVLKLNKLILPDAVSILDRCLASMQSDKDISKEQLNCLIIVSFWISTKKHSRKKKLLNVWLSIIEPVLFMTEIQHRKVWYNTSTTHDEKLTLIKLVKQNLAIVQAFILQQINFDLDKVNTLQILYIFGKINKLKSKTQMLARYFLQLSLYIDFERFNKEISQAKNTFVNNISRDNTTDISNFENTVMITVLSSLYLSCFFLQNESWPLHYPQIFNVNPTIIDKCANHLFEIAISAKNQQPKFAVVFQKYNRTCYMNISNIQFKQREDQYDNRSNCESKCSKTNQIQNFSEFNLEEIDFQIRALNSGSKSNIPETVNQQARYDDLIFKPFLRRKSKRENCNKLSKIKEKQFSWATLRDIMDTSIGQKLLKKNETPKHKRSLKILKIQTENKLLCI